MTRKKRGYNSRKTHCIRGHEFTNANTRWSKEGGRNCKKCEPIRAAIRRNASARA